MVTRRPLRPRISHDEYRLLMRLRDRKPAQHPPKPDERWGEIVADRVAEIIGSWYFIIIQSIILGIWVILNLTAYVQHWDPYPFILLNLMLSFQSAYAGPIIMMSQNRQGELDRIDTRHDAEVNLKAELEIELLHDKINLIREQEFVEIKQLLIKQQEQIKYLETLLVSSKAIVLRQNEDISED